MNIKTFLADLFNAFVFMPIIAAAHVYWFGDGGLPVSADNLKDLSLQLLYRTHYPDYSILFLLALALPFTWLLLILKNRQHKPITYLRWIGLFVGLMLAFILTISTFTNIFVLDMMINLTIVLKSLFMGLIFGHTHYLSHQLFRTHVGDFKQPSM